MNNRIELNLDKSVTRLAGYEYGKSIYDEQVKGKVDFNSTIIIVFPDNILKLASSFVQGFFGEMVDKIGIAGIESNVIIESYNTNLHKEIIKNLL